MGARFFRGGTEPIGEVLGEVRVEPAKQPLQGDGVRIETALRAPEQFVEGPDRLVGGDFLEELSGAPPAEIEIVDGGEQPPQPLRAGHGQGR